MRTYQDSEAVASYRPNMKTKAEAAFQCVANGVSASATGGDAFL